MGGTHDGSLNAKKTWNEIFTQEQQWIDFFSKKGIWVICTQEDLLKSNFINALRTNIFKDLEYIMIDKTPRAFSKQILSTILNPINENVFSVHLSIFVPKNYNINENSLIKKESLYHSIREDKGSEYIIPDDNNKSFFNFPTIKSIKQNALGFIHDKLFLLKSSAVIEVGQIRFVGSHFPFVKSSVINSADVGKKALEKILTTYNNDNKLMFILGDLNFRRTSEGTNLLTNKLKELNITNVTKSLVNNNKSTCKTIKKRDYTLCKNSTTTNDKNICFNSSRKASLCDRLLIVNKKELVIKEPQSEIVLIPPINQSDHNAVYAKVEVPISLLLPQQGGVYKKTKERILIGKRNAIVYRSADKQNSRLKYIRKKGEWVKI
jgi:hypothetical protein